MGVGQPQLLQLLVDLGQQGLVAGNGLGVTGMAFHPADDFGAVFEQLVGHVGIHQGGQGHVLGLDHVKVIAQGHGKFLALVTAGDIDLAPSIGVRVGGCSRVESHALTHALVPAPVRSAHGFTDFDGQRNLVATEAVVRLDFLPAFGVGVILDFQHQVFFDGCPSGWGKAVGLATHALAIGRAHQLDDGAGTDRQCNILQVQGGIVVLLAFVQAQCCFFGCGQVLAHLVSAQLGFVVDLVGQQLHQCAVVDARFNGRHLTDIDAVIVLFGRVSDRWQGDRNRHRDDGHARAYGPFSNTNTRLGQQDHVTNRAHSGRPGQVDGVVFNHLGGGHRQTHAQRDQGQVSLRCGGHHIGRTRTVLTCINFDFIAQQICTTQGDGVVGIQARIGIRTSPPHIRHRQHIGASGHVGIASGGQGQVTAEVAQLGLTHVDARTQVSILVSQRHRQGQPTDGINADLVGHRSLRVGVDAETAGLTSIGRHRHFGAVANVDLSTETFAIGADVRHRAQSRQTQRSGRTRAQRLFRGRVAVFVGHVVGTDRDIARHDFAVLANLHVRRARQRGEHGRATARQCTHGQVQSHCVEVLAACRPNVQQPDGNLVTIAQTRTGRALNFQVGIRTRKTCKNAAAGGAGTLIDVVLGFGMDAQHGGHHTHIITQLGHHRTTVGGDDCRRAHRSPRADTQGIAAGKGLLVGQGQHFHFAGTQRGQNIGSTDGRHHFGVEAVDRNGARGRCRNGAKTGGSSNDQSVGLGIALGANGQIFACREPGLARLWVASNRD